MFGLHDMPDTIVLVAPFCRISSVTSSVVVTLGSVVNVVIGCWRPGLRTSYTFYAINDQLFGSTFLYSLLHNA